MSRNASPRFTAERQHRTFTDSHSVVVHYYLWAPAKPKAIVQLAHGVGEHALRYETLAQSLVAAGYAVFADDHRGHGATGVEYWKGDLSKIGKLGLGGLRATQQNVLELTALAKAEFPAVPFVMLGHSWGSLMVQNLLNHGAHPWSAVVLTGTALRTPLDMNGGDLNARHKHLGDTGAEWLSRDPAVSRTFADDPLTTDAKVLQLFGVVDGLRLFGTPRRVQPPVPLVIMVGDDDPLGGEKSAKKLADAYLRRGGLTDVELIVYAGARHEIFNETNQAEVRADLIAWLDDRLFAAS